MPARRQRGGSSNWLLGLVRLSLLSRHHSTVGLSPKRHGKRYEERFSTEMFAHTSDLRGRGIAPEDVKVEGNPTGLPGALDRDVRAAQEIHRGHREGRIAGEGLGTTLADLFSELDWGAGRSDAG
jgi:hypothetical protein